MMSHRNVSTAIGLQTETHYAVQGWVVRCPIFSERGESTSTLQIRGRNSDISSNTRRGILSKLHILFHAFESSFVPELHVHYVLF